MKTIKNGDPKKEDRFNVHPAFMASIFPDSPSSNIPEGYEWNGRSMVPVGWNEFHEEKDSTPEEEILRRIRWKESRFDPSAESPAGAKGVAQFMPSTWRDMQQRGFVGPEETPNSPTSSLKAQAAYWNDLGKRTWIDKPELSETNKNVRKAMAYNWGPTNTLRFLNGLKDRGVDIESDNFKWLDYVSGDLEAPLETKDYVRKVILGENERFENEYRSAGEESYMN